MLKSIFEYLRDNPDVFDVETGVLTKPNMVRVLGLGHIEELHHKSYGVYTLGPFMLELYKLWKEAQDVDTNSN